MIQIVDNVQCKTISTLIPAIESATDIRIAVAFVSNDGVSLIMPVIERQLAAGSNVEFLVGMDPRATDPVAIRELYSLSQKNQRATLLCFVPRSTSILYHPKMYLMRNEQVTTAIIGSSNLTHSGLTSNIEANVMIQDDIHSELMSEIFNTYYRLKFHPLRVVPDDEFIDIFADLCKVEKRAERQQARQPEIHTLRQAFSTKAKTLQRPKPSKSDLFGWLELVYDVLPEGEFSNQDIYAYEDFFRQYYPYNMNIRAKIRQQLQLLQRLGFIQHVAAGVWRKL
ncbi:MAG: NgoFVII family restriction endonuclease [Anaerolineae bacterium]|nr:NgoFVII family restriction endonuclease [Anaerolineae bacterium]